MPWTILTSILLSFNYLFLAFKLLNVQTFVNRLERGVETLGNYLFWFLESA